MKSNRKFIIDTNAQTNYGALIITVIAFMMTIIVGVLVYYTTSDNVDQFNAVTETFTGYTALTACNSTQQVELDNSPVNVGSVNITAFNATGSNQYHITNHTLINKIVYVTRQGANSSQYGYTQLNITYTSNIASLEDETTDMAGSVFEMAPIIGLILIAAAIIGIVIAFGTGKTGYGGM